MQPRQSRAVCIFHGIHVCRNLNLNLNLNFQADKQATLANHKKHSSDLDSKIVSSPERMESEMEHMEMQMEQRKSAVLERTKRLQELRAQKENLETIHSELDKLQKLQAAIKIIMDQQK